MLRITVLGSGTSTGVPVPACDCPVCLSGDPKNDRLRSSVLIEAISDLGAILCSLLVDTSVDLRQQCLRYKIPKVDAVIYTHCHADHVFGLDDLRAFNFVSGGSIPVYASPDTAPKLRETFPYAFKTQKHYPGGSPPQLNMKIIEHGQSFLVAGSNFDLEVMPLLVLHGSLPVTALRIGDFAYLTDCSAIPEESIKHLFGLDVLILDGLRERPHLTHFNHAQAVEAIETIKPKKTYLTHLSHEVDYERGNLSLRKMTHLSVELAYDGLIIEV